MDPDRYGGQFCKASTGSSIVCLSVCLQKDQQYGSREIDHHGTESVNRNTKTGPECEYRLMESPPAPPETGLPRTRPKDYHQSTVRDHWNSCQAAHLMTACPSSSSDSLCGILSTMTGTLTTSQELDRRGNRLLEQPQSNRTWCRVRTQLDARSTALPYPLGRAPRQGRNHLVGLVRCIVGSDRLRIIDCQPRSFEE